ncbi:down syndrome cell adhesion molecule-like protein Dscam2 [Caerostris extrusa]|uniref:Down syndrome cell adhesion molecule-like protein Dscam2 n=1 Tax=Caerostris extrusa TaxID=172846 RepID=A0AAV4S267_CAEEX|nr:down syndrome cell adhesion molecule-like protein Dscam2 [Caerostris extrusa]
MRVSRQLRTPRCLDTVRPGAEPSTEPRIRTGDIVSHQGHVTSYLNISDARVEDSGVYRCDISNDVGAVWHSARLNVYGPPFIRPFPNISAISGQELVLNCPVGGYPIKSITWQKGT